MSGVEVRVLGPPSLRVEGEERPLPRKAFALLSVLCLGDTQTREALAALLWERERRLAGQNLRAALFALRRALGPHAPLVRVERERLWLEADAPGLWVDARRLGNAPASELPELWRGPLLSGLGLRDSPAWDDWVGQQEDALSRLHLERCLTLGDRALRAGEPDLAAALAGQALAVTPGSEAALRLLVAAQYASGRGGVAQLSAEQFRSRFRAEYGAEPEGLSPPVPRPLARDLAPPASLSPLIGREGERAALLAALRTHRLITLHGPAGIGKTRLAGQVALDVELAWPEFLVRTLPLEPLRDPDTVQPRLAEALGVPGGPDPLAALASALRSRPALLVLDNAEHLLGPSPLWADLASLLPACPALRLLVTSREVLNLAAEHVFPLQGLEVPAPDWPEERARAAGAVRLFEERAQRASAAFSLGGTLDDVREVTRRLGGSPLGLELAAAWTRRQTPGEIRAALSASPLDLRSPWRDAPERHVSLRAALEQSWARLSPAEQRDAAALGVFPASFTPEAAQDVAGLEAGRLAPLMDHALLTRNAGGRYGFHPLTRALLTEKLAGDPDRRSELEARHAAHFRRELDRLNTESSGGASPALMDYVEAEEAHVLALVDHLLRRGPLIALREVAEPLLWHFPVRGRPGEGLRLCRRVIAALRPWAGEGQEGAGLALAAFLNTQGWLEHFFGDLHEAARLCGEAAVWAEHAGADLERSRAHQGLGQVQMRMGEFALSAASCERGVEAAAALNGVRQHRMLVSLGLAWTYAGELEKAAGAYRRAQVLAEGRAVIGPMDQASRLYGIGLMQTVAGQGRTARTTLLEAERVARSIASSGQLSSILGVAALAGAIEDPREGAEHICNQLTQVQGLLGNRAEPWTECVLEHARARLALAAGDPGAALAHCRRAYEAAWPSGNVAVTFWTLPVYARALAAGGQPTRAAEVVGLLLHHPASGRWTREQAQVLLREWTPPLPGMERALNRGAGLTVPELFGQRLA